MQVIDEMDDVVGQGGCVIDYHSCEFFPERWFDMIFVLRTDNSILYTRLEQRLVNPHNFICLCIQGLKKMPSNLVKATKNSKPKAMSLVDL